MDEPRICACGCGGVIPPKRHHRWRPPAYLVGHWTKASRHRKYEPRPEEIPSGKCECGCGGVTPIATVTRRVRRHFAGHPMPFMHGHFKAKRGADSPRWKGGRVVNRKYVLAYAPDHPQANSKGYVAEHRIVMEQTLGRELHPDETVHHLNGDGHDNRPENLELRVGRHGVGATHAHCRTCTCFAEVES